MILLISGINLLVFFVKDNRENSEDNDECENHLYSESDPYNSCSIMEESRMINISQPVIFLQHLFFFPIVSDDNCSIDELRSH